MAQQYLDIKKVAVIGAGVSGVAAGIYLKRAGLDVRVFERSPRAGGIWVFDERTARDAAYPSILPSAGDSPEFVQQGALYHKRRDSPLSSSEDFRNDEQGVGFDDLSLSFAPPGPAYRSLKNNVSTIEMEMDCQSWKPGTGEFVQHNFLADYIQDAHHDNEMAEMTSFNARVDNLRKVNERWRLKWSQLEQNTARPLIEPNVEDFDAVVVATGNYHACSIPDIPGLAEWKHAFPDKVRHSKLYRDPDEFVGKNVLLIGAGVSSTDIARDLGTIARAIYQSSRGGPFDIPSHILPANAARVGGIAKFSRLSSPSLDADGTIPGTVTLASGEKLCGIHEVIVCTGYYMSYPFMRQYHADDVRMEEADDNVIVTEGQQTHNLHKDIWYIPDPTLSFIGIPYHTATFSLFEFQAKALARVFSGQAPLPEGSAMRREYRNRLAEKGAGRYFHSLRKVGHEIAYVNELVDLANSGPRACQPLMTGHSDKWLEAYARRRQRYTVLLETVRDPELDIRVIDLLQGC